MDQAQIDALVAATQEGVESDVLSATREDGTYSFSVPETSYEGLTETEFREAARQHEPHIGEWHFWSQVVPAMDDRRAFLRWLEGEGDSGGRDAISDRSVPDHHETLREGVSQTWGQLEVQITLAEAGRRVYEVRHVADGDERVEDLAVHTDPLDAREIAKRDERDRYRPLSTAPTLQRGWVFVDLDPEEVVRTVDTFYPATIANWHRERDGDLDVTHWPEAADRQTGIYGVVGELDREAVAWVAESCCVDSQCLKRREWDGGEDDLLDVPRGDGAFPCREPCSLVVAAARQWAMLEREETRTYEFELTPSEKAQIEDVVGAVAEGTTEEIREADVGEGANRYRARYLRAKRFEDGNLCGVPTGETVSASHHDHDEGEEEDGHEQSHDDHTH
jgi:hypothetical protein